MGKNSKREEAQQAMNRRLQKQREAMELQKQQNRLIRNTMLVVLAFVLIAASIGMIVTGCNRKKAKEESKSACRNALSFFTVIQFNTLFWLKLKKGFTKSPFS